MDPHHFNAGPDPSSHLHADPDPASQNNADPNPQLWYLYSLDSGVPAAHSGRDTHEDDDLIAGRSAH